MQRKHRKWSLTLHKYDFDIVNSKLVLIEEKETPIEDKTTDYDEGTYLVSLTPQQFGKHTLSLTIKVQSMQGSLFIAFVVTSQDYTILKNLLSYT